MELRRVSLQHRLVIFPQLTQLDFTGPQQVLARLPDSATHIIAKSPDPVPSDC
jgi:cyclohexyl-isocyanide hydratase